MGTPGEKANVVREVVKGELQNQSQPPPHHLHTPAAEPEPPSLGAASSPSSYLLRSLLPAAAQSVLPQQPQEMGVTVRRPPPSRIPIATYDELGTASLSSSTSLAQNPMAKTENLGLEQPSIEDYFQQSKFYPPAAIEYSSPSYLTVSSIIPNKPRFLPTLLEHPGPSGLQTPKLRASSSSATSTLTTANVAKPKKRSRPALTGDGVHGLYGCRFCHKSFANLNKLEKHQQTHLGSSPFKCENCKKSFTSKFKLVRHALIHSDRKPFSCSVCDRTFHRKDHLKNHIKVHSPQKEIFICSKDGCKKQYTSLLSFRKHQAVHAAEEGNLTCQICTESFESKEDIIYHLKIHAGSRTVKNPSERKFTCEVCDRRFFTKKDVRRHLVVHTGMRDFLCQFCPQRFGRKDHLVRHIKKSHNTKLKPPSETVTTATIKTEIVTTMKETTTVNPSEIKIKSEFSEGSLIKSEFLEGSLIKSEFSEGSLSNPETFAPSLVDLDFLPEDLSQFDSQLFLPSTSEQDELKDLGSEILEGIEESASISNPNLLISETLTPTQVGLDDVVLNDPELLQQILHSAAGEGNLPLPGFSQTFHSQPPPQQGPPE